MQFVAWSARNLLELETWARFVLKNEENARRFAKDWIMDGIGISDSMIAWHAREGEPDPPIRKLRERLSEGQAKHLPGVTGYIRLINRREELGM
jgi:hypothetical protein